MSKKNNIKRNRLFAWQTFHLINNDYEYIDYDYVHTFSVRDEQTTILQYILFQKYIE